MKYFKKIHVILLASIISVACEADFEETNRNPNEPVNVSPAYLLNTSIFNTINLFGGDMRERVFSHYSHYVSVGGGQFERYATFPASNNGYWETAYVDCLQPLQQIQLNYGDDPEFNNRVAIAKIFENYLFSQIVAIWGSVPKTHALTGEPYIPYDKEEEIYYDILADLKEAAESIEIGGDKYSSSADAIYNGDLEKWRKFAITLRLRIAVRLSNANEGEANNVITEILTNESQTISSQDETANAFWGTNSSTWSYLYQENVVEAVSNASSLAVINESLIQYMLPYEDPRLPIYAEPASQGPREGEYFGQPKTTDLPEGVEMNPNPHLDLAPADYSMIGDYFLRPDEEFVFLSYAESSFLKSEAALKGWGGTKSAEEYYTEGITASMAKYNIPKQDINIYLEKPGIAWNTAVDTTGRGNEFTDFIGITTSAILEPDPFRQIVMQDWIAGFYQGLDAWTLIRRTQVLEFPPHFNPDEGEGGTVGYAHIPQRIKYPDIEYQVNLPELEKALQWLDGPDALKTKLWFALPTKTNPFLPE
jgi:hypothetical protein